IAETVSMKGHNGDAINAYLARPLGAGPFPGMVVIHHAPGWDEWYRECTRKFAHHGFVAISPNLYFRDGHGTPEDVGAKVRAAGGAPDARVLGDLDGANRSEEHTSELQSRFDLVCRLLLEKKKNTH